MAAITDKLFELEATLEGMVIASGDTMPKKGELSDIVSHLDYIIELLGTMVSAETYEEVKEKQTKGFNGIYDRTDTINELLKSGEISGDVDLYPLTITENGTYSAGAGKGYSRVVAVVDSGADPDIEDGLVTRTLTSYTNSRITSIGNSAFVGCTSLTTVSFPECTSIGNNAFAACSSLTTVSFPKCTSIGSIAFVNCFSLTTVSFPKCTSIGNSAFTTCFSLTTASFPECTSIEKDAFTACSSLTTVSFPKCTNIGNAAFANCSSLTTVSFPECTSIEKDAFAACSSLTTASFPKCTSIGNRAFTACSSLTTIYLNSSSLTNLVTNISSTFGNYSNITYYVPASLIDSYRSARYWSAVSSQFSAYDFSD